MAGKTTAPGWPVRDHDITRLTGSELEQARGERAASLALAWLGSPVRVSSLVRIRAIDTELPASQPTGPTSYQAPRRPDPDGPGRTG